MAQIIPKLNLNKTPALVESNSLVFSKNIRLDVDGTIHRDYGVFPMSIHKGNNINNLVNYKTIINRIISDIDYELQNNSNVKSYYNTIYNKLRLISSKNIVINNIQYKDGSYNIVGVISDSNEFYIFIYGTYTSVINNIDTENNESIIIKYDEKEDKFSPCNCNWNWSGGIIHGCVINNLIGEKILNVGEYGVDNLVPLKSINLNVSTITEDESIYTQIPNVPLTNLYYGDSFSHVIPNGVYQFFVRYKIRKNFYTNWFPASNDIFVGNKNNIITSFGTLSYTNTHRDSDNSFILLVEHIVEFNKNNYESFQIGFILSHDDATYARAWKHFDFNVSTINFDYKAEDAEELEITDFLKPIYGLYNVGNITTFKNKLYISNYTETDFNDDSLRNIAELINVEIKTKEGGNTYDGNPVLTSNIGNKEVISGLTISGINTDFIGEAGLFYKILNTSINENIPTIYDSIENVLNNNTESKYTAPNSITLNGIRIIPKIDNFISIQKEVRKSYKDVNTSYMRQTNDVTFPNNDIESITINGIKDSSSNILQAIYNTPRYLNNKCNWINANGVLDNTIIIKIARKAKVVTTTTYYNTLGGFKLHDTSIDDSNVDLIGRPGEEIVGQPGGISTTTKTTTPTYYQEIEIKFAAFETKYSNTDAITLINNTTLLPYQRYKFYIHFVKSTGEITNGYYCSNVGEIEAPYMPNCTSVIYPIFKNIIIPKGYSSCFFSIVHTKVNIATVFNIENSINTNEKEGSCVDVNMMLIPGNKNIHVKQGINGSNSDIETFSAQYYGSSDSSLPRYFGADGVIVIDDDNFDKNKLAYVINDYSVSETENVELIKCTPYLDYNNLNKENGVYYFDEYSKMNLLGFICCITPLLRDVCIKYYSDGSSVYFKSNDEDNTGIYNPTGTLYLQELSKYNDADVDADKKLMNFSLKNSANVYIYSNYNLNYVALSEEPKMSIKTFYRTPSNSANTESNTEANKEKNSSTIVLRLISSQLMSGIYIIPSGYKSYIRKTYSQYKDNEITRFDNTIRSSILYGDENNINILSFDANDYYNIPTNRGIIINMISVGDAIVVHTQDSMFKFSGSNTIQSSDGEIQTSESRPFDTGVSEIFGSDFGFAGIQNKFDHIITENGYIFFDRDSRIVYLYSGQGQIVKISDSIEKLFRHKDISNINFANDYYNNRFFMSIIFYKDYEVIENNNKVIKRINYPVTLSFNTSENIKAFVSLHDFYYHYAFNTKTNCYFLTEDNKDICYVDKIYKGCYSKLELVTDKTYPQRSQPFKIEMAVTDTINSTIVNTSVKIYDSIVDVIVNDSFESIKTLNAVNWCGNKVLSEFKEVNETDITTLIMTEEINYEIPCKYLRIYSDTCMTPLNVCDERSNDKPINSINNYKYPRYNQGYWTFNYFRNILNSKNHVTNTTYSGDNNSLIEGKYFVTRFVFDTDFKLETLTLNFNIKQ